MYESYYAGANVDRYGFFSDITPALADVIEEEKQAAIDVADARATDAMLPPLPSLQDDPYSWGKAKEGQTPEQRRQEAVEIASRRRMRKIAQRDTAALGQEQDPETIFSQARVAAQQRLQSAVESKSKKPRERLTEPKQPPERITNTQQAAERITETQQRSQRHGEEFQRQQREAARSGFFADTSTFADLPPRTPTIPRRHEFSHQSTETFSRAQMEFDYAAEHLLTALAKAVSACTSRVEEVERWIEMEGKN